MKKSRKQKRENYLKGVYYNPSKAGSFGGIDKLHHYIKEKGKYKFSRKEIQKWLKAQEVHTTNLLSNHFVRRRQVIVPYIDYMWDVDTASMREYAKQNKGFGFFILAIDIMSRFVWCEPIKTPNGRETKAALQKIFEGERKPEKMRTDKGTEFSNKDVQEYLGKESISHFVTQNEVKANYAERAIQTIKGKLMRYMRAKQTPHWIDQLQNIVSSYNNTIHRSIKQSPISVTKNDENKLWELLYSPKKIASLIPKKLTYKFDVGDIVRISRLRHAFQRYYNEHWTNELFIIKTRNLQQYVPTYTLTDYAKDPIQGIFYEEELQKVFVDENATYNIEKVVQERVRNGKRESLIRWKGWPKKFDSWILSKNIKSFT